MNAQDAYLDDVRRRLDGLTRTQRATVLDDLRGHLADAADAGRSDEEAITALGSPTEIAARVYEEFGSAPIAVERARRALLWTAVGIGIALAVIVAFLLPSYTTIVDADGLEELMVPQNLFDVMGLAGPLICLVPAAVVLVPLLVPERARNSTTLAAAIILTAFSIVGGFTIGGFFTPVAMLAWGAVITPWRLRAAGGFSLGWRVAGAAVVLLPALALLGGLLTGTLGLSVVSVLMMLVAAALAVLMVLGHRAAGWAVAALGAITLLSVLLNAGMLAIAVVWAGGMLLAVGLSHALGARRD